MIGLPGGMPCNSWASTHNHAHTYTNIYVESFTRGISAHSSLEVRRPMKRMTSSRRQRLGEDERAKIGDDIKIRNPIVI